ncbi:MAG: hypothetical protein AAGI23_18445 [Bacteroidota bacterium]
MKLTYSFLLFLLFATTLTAQQVRVKYTDGTYFNGEVLSDTEQELTLLTHTGDTVRINQAYVEKRYDYPEDAMTFNKGKYHPVEGWYLHFGLASSIGNGVNVQFDGLVGRRLSQNWSVGLDLAWHQYHPNFTWNVTDDFFTPSLYGRRYLTKRKTRLYVDANVGYGLALLGGEWGISERSQSNGLFGSAGVGVHFASRSKTRYLLSLGQNFQYSEGRFVENFFINEQPRIVEYDLWYIRPMLRVAVEFF